MRSIDLRNMPVSAFGEVGAARRTSLRDRRAI
jgi:hypothetical protein